MSNPTTNQILNKSLVSGTTITDALNTLRVTQGDGSGDMLRSVYDADNDGKVDVANVAEAVPWTGVTDKPTLFPAQPYTHNHAISEVTGLQSALDGKQETLVSGDNIKSVNGSSILGSGDITITSGVTDHGALTGLTDDDHTQYHNDSRGDARYSLLAHSHTATSISNTPSGGITSTTVQGAINELDTEKLSVSGNGAITSSSGQLSLTLAGGSDRANLVLGTGAADGSGVVAGAIPFTAAASTSGGAETRIAIIQVVTDGATANSRGGKLQFVTKVNGANTLASRLEIDSAGNVLVISGVLGYGAGAGGTVTQATSRTTAVTLNKAYGHITLVSAAGSASWQTFSVNNSLVAATDSIDVQQVSGSDKYRIHVTRKAAGVFDVTFCTTGGTTTEQPVFSFTATKGSTS
jgi:hypothetical protein